MGYNEAFEELKANGLMPPEQSGESSVKQSVKDMEIIYKMEDRCGFIYSAEQKEVLKHHGNLDIIACAGSGKTTTIAHLITKRILSGEIKDISKMVCTTYSKAGAIDLAQRVNKVMLQNGIRFDFKPRICTLHAFFLELLKVFGFEGTVIDEGQRLEHVRKACKEVMPNLQYDDVLVISNMLSFQINNLYGDDTTVGSCVDLQFDLPVEKYAKIRSAFTASKRLAGHIDFDDMQTILYKWMCLWDKMGNDMEKAMSKQVREYCRNAYTDYFIDEAQDISKIQFKLIKALTLESEGKPSANVVFIGDDDQAIYSWRGSDPSIILTLQSVFNLHLFKLTTNYRCGKNILKLAATGIANNEDRYEKDMTAANDYGKVEIKLMPSSGLYEYTVECADKIEKYISEGYRKNNIAVLCRQNIEVAILPYVLAERGIYCEVKDAKMRLTNAQYFKDIKDLIDIVDMADNKFTIQRVLWKLVPYVRKTTATKFADTISGAGLHFKEYLEVIFNTKSNLVPSSVASSLREELQAEFDVTKMNALAEIYKIFKSGNDVKQASGLMYYYYGCVEGFLFRSEEAKRRVVGAVKYADELIKRVGIQNARSAWRNLQQMDTGTMDIPGDKVVLSSVHSAKGREWDAVIIFAADSIAFPSSTTIRKVIASGTELHPGKAYIDEERRLFYVGCTRARKELCILTSNSMCPFLIESLGAVPDADTFEHPNDFVEMVATTGYSGELIENCKKKATESNDSNEVGVGNGGADIPFVTEERKTDEGFTSVEDDEVPFDEGVPHIKGNVEREEIWWDYAARSAGLELRADT